MAMSAFPCCASIAIRAAASRSIRPSSRHAWRSVRRRPLQQLLDGLMSALSAKIVVAAQLAPEDECIHLRGACRRHHVLVDAEHHQHGERIPAALRAFPGTASRGPVREAAGAGRRIDDVLGQVHNVGPARLRPRRSRRHLCTARCRDPRPGRYRHLGQVLHHSARSRRTIAARTTGARSMRRN